MTKEASPLCAERHYMGSSSTGRYATDRSLRPSYDRLPTAQDLAQSAACHTANHTRYIREQDVLWWVVECEEAKAELADGENLLARLHAAHEAASRDDARANLAQRIAALEEHLARTLRRRKEASRELRLIGVSPKAQARIAARLRANAQG